MLPPPPLIPGTKASGALSLLFGDDSDVQCPSGLLGGNVEEREEIQLDAFYRLHK
jgi:hypothetical protein